LVPYLGVGKGLFLRADGECFDDEFLLRPLSADDSYGSGSAYWTVGLGTSVDLSNSISLGLSGYLQSKQSLSESHFIRPYGLRIFFGKCLF